MAGFLTTFLIGVSFLAGATIQLLFGGRHPIGAPVASLIVAVVIGLVIRRIRRPRFAKADNPARTWEEHCEAHERAMRGSTTMTPPGARHLHDGGSFKASGRLFGE